jgi:Cd2+/Zn2+-exporting ATPase
MLTGDSEKTAKAVADELGITDYASELLPQDKVAYFEKLMEETGGQEGKNYLAFIGDGINDAPVLSRADIGFAMGSMGSDAAIEAADIVIMDDDIGKIPRVIRIARKTMGIVKANIVFALAVKFLVLILGALGIANMWAAVFADVGVAVIAILNSMRTLNMR